MTRLADLHPEYGATNTPGLHWLTFDCQTTHGQRVYVLMHAGPAQTGVWQCTTWRVDPALAHLGETPDIANLTLLPSIGDHAHGRGPRCPGHVSIINGEVVP